jgi:hypothetical protein
MPARKLTVNSSLTVASFCVEGHGPSRSCHGASAIGVPLAALTYAALFPDHPGGVIRRLPAETTRFVHLPGARHTIFRDRPDLAFPAVRNFVAQIRESQPPAARIRGRAWAAPPGSAAGSGPLPVTAC